MAARLTTSPRYPGKMGYPTIYQRRNLPPPPRHNAKAQKGTKAVQARSPAIMSRAGLYPLWSDLSERTDMARARFRAGGPEVLFRATLHRLGFTWTQIQIEIAENRPGAK